MIEDATNVTNSSGRKYRTQSSKSQGKDQPDTIHKFKSRKLCLRRSAAETIAWVIRRGCFRYEEERAVLPCYSLCCTYSVSGNFLNLHNSSVRWVLNEPPYTDEKTELQSLRNLLQFSQLRSQDLNPGVTQELVFLSIYCHIQIERKKKKDSLGHYYTQTLQISH